MKLRILPFMIGSSLAVSFAYGSVTIALNPTLTAAGETGVGAFVFEVLESQLSNKENYELVDRKRLSDLLAEQTLGASGMTTDQVSKVGKLVGAKYFITGESKQAGEKTAIQCRVVQVETGVLKPVLLIVSNTEDPMKAGEDLAKQVTAALAKLEDRASSEKEVAELTKKFTVPTGSKFPTVAMRIPEVSVTPNARTADPAAEKTLESFLQQNGCKLVQLSRPSQSSAAGQQTVPTAATTANVTPVSTTQTVGAHLEGKEHEDLLQEARLKKVDVIILGIATSDRGTQIGNFVASRARVELAAVRVSDSQILATTSGYGVASDISSFVSEKKAIEAATAKIQNDFAEKIVVAFSSGK